MPCDGMRCDGVIVGVQQTKIARSVVQNPTYLLHPSSLALPFAHNKGRIMLLLLLLVWSQPKIDRFPDRRVSWSATTIEAAFMAAT